MGEILGIPVCPRFKSLQHRFPMKSAYVRCKRYAAYPKTGLTGGKKPLAGEPAEKKILYYVERSLPKEGLVPYMYAISAARPIRRQDFFRVMHGLSADRTLFPRPIRRQDLLAEAIDTLLGRVSDGVIGNPVSKLLLGFPYVIRQTRSIILPRYVALLRQLPSQRMEGREIYIGMQLGIVDYLPSPCSANLQGMTVQLGNGATASKVPARSSTCSPSTPEPAPLALELDTVPLKGSQHVPYLFGHRHLQSFDEDYRGHSCLPAVVLRPAKF
ncbi:hypothetical protein KC345_g22 [Hortaea werneckii]|nr:hypothetical protein KC345_g22 [Hortaea werneckii]